VIIKSTSNQNINVHGGFKVAGTEAEPVIFTALADDNAGASNDVTDNDTEGNGNANDPTTSEWGSIIFESESDDVFSSIDQAEFWYGGRTYNYSYPAPIAFDNAAATVSNSIIKFSGNYGLYIANNSTPAIDNVLIQSSYSDPIGISFFADPTFSNMTFDANASNGLALIETTLSSNATVRKRDIAGIQNIAYKFRCYIDGRSWGCF
jgi:hypothetical protein